MQPGISREILASLLSGYSSRIHELKEGVRVIEQKLILLQERYKKGQDTDLQRLDEYIRERSTLISRRENAVSVLNKRLKDEDELEQLRLQRRATIEKIEKLAYKYQKMSSEITLRGVVGTLFYSLRLYLNKVNDPFYLKTKFLALKKYKLAMLSELIQTHEIGPQMHVSEDHIHYAVMRLKMQEELQKKLIRTDSKGIFASKE